MNKLTNEWVEVDELVGDVDLVLYLYHPDVVVDLFKHLISLDNDYTWIFI